MAGLPLDRRSARPGILRLLLGIWRFGSDLRSNLYPLQRRLHCRLVFRRLALLLRIRLWKRLQRWLSSGNCHFFKRVLKYQRIHLSISNAPFRLLGSTGFKMALSLAASTTAKGASLTWSSLASTTLKVIVPHAPAKKEQHPSVHTSASTVTLVTSLKTSTTAPSPTGSLLLSTPV